MEGLRRYLPSREQLRNNRWLAWAHPHLDHPRLWRWSRRGVALGVALGVFFGLLIPIAQIPASAAAAVVMRANLPAAVASTLVTNPVTFGPIYYAAYRLGRLVVENGGAPPAAEPSHEAGFLERVRALGRPLIVGLAILATVCGLVAYGAVSLVWWAWERFRQPRRGNPP